MTTYSEKLKDPRWQKKRLKILERDEWTCKECGAKDKTLHVHHTEYKGNPWEIEDFKLKTLCFECHNDEHSQKKKDFKYNTVRLLEPAFKITGDELVKIPHEHLGYKCPDNKYGISAQVQYEFFHVCEYRNINQIKFKERFNNPKFTLKEYRQSCENDLQKECIRENIILKTIYGHFGSQQNVIYQNVIFPLSVLTLIDKVNEIRVMSESQYRKIYTKSKFSKMECIDDLIKGVNRDLRVLKVGFTYCDMYYGI